MNRIVSTACVILLAAAWASAQDSAGASARAPGAAARPAAGSSLISGEPNSKGGAGDPLGQGQAARGGPLVAPAGIRLSGGPLDATGMSYGRLTATNAALQNFTQLDQPTGTPFPGFAGYLFDHSAVNGNLFNAVFKTTTTNELCANRPAGQMGPPCHHVALYAEGRSTPGQSSDYSVYAFNIVAEGNANHNGWLVVQENDINQGYIAAPSTDYMIAVPGNRIAVSQIHTSGGRFQPHVGTLYQAAPGKQYIRAEVIDHSAFTHRAIEVGNVAAPIPASLPGVVAVKHINGGNSILNVRATDASPSGNFVANYNAAGTSLLSSMETDGDIFSSTKLYTIGGDGLQLWKDQRPSRAWNVGLKVPGGPQTNDLVFGKFNGAAWAEGMRLKGDSNALSLGAQAVSVVWGAGAPAGACGPGLYIRTDAGAGAPALYVCQGSAWVAK